MAGGKKSESVARAQAARERMVRAAAGVKGGRIIPPPDAKAALLALAAGFAVGYSPRVRSGLRMAVKAAAAAMGTGTDRRC